MNLNQKVMIIDKEKNEAIFIGTLFELPHAIMEAYKPVALGYDKAINMKTVIVKRRQKHAK